MFGTLFKKECRQTFRSLLYWLIIIFFIITITSQMWDGEVMDSLDAPEPGQTYYGFYGLKETDDPQLIMEQALKELFIEAGNGVFATYPAGFYKEVKPDEEELEEIKGILKSASGKSWDELIEDYNEYFETVDYRDEMESYIAWETYGIAPADGYTYEMFEQDMKRVCEIVGRGSSYEKSSYENSAVVRMTYEAALEEFEELCQKDRITRALMRLYCDYAGITLAFLAIFLGVAVGIRDKRAKACDVIFAKEASSLKIMLSRYFANVFMLFLPVVIMAGVLEMPYVYAAQQLGIDVDIFAFIWIPFVWLLPEIMVALALAGCICELAGGIAAIVIQVFWGLASLMSAATLTGDFKLRLIIRWNRMGGYSDFMGECRDLYLNRGYYFALAVILLFLTVGIYNWKRKNGGKIPWIVKRK